MLKEIKSLFRKKKLDLSSICALASQVGAKEAFEKTNALSRAIDKEWLEAIEPILKTGVNPNLPEDHPPLVMLVDHPFMSATSRVHVLTLLIEQGADVNAGVWTGKGALEMAVGRKDGIDCVRLLNEQKGLLPVHRSNAISAAIRRGAEGAEHTLEMLDLMLESVDDLTTADRSGLAAIHAAAAHGNLAAIQRLVEAGTDLDLALSADARIEAHHCTPPGGGVVPEIVFPAGLAPLDVAERTLEFYRLKQEDYGDATGEGNRDAKQRAARVELLEATVAKLNELGATRGAAKRRDDEPPYRSEVDTLLGQLAECAGADTAALRRLLEGTSTSSRGPWGYLSAVIGRAAPLLMQGHVADRAADHWLGRLLLRGDRWFAKPGLNRRDFPEEAHECIAEKEFIGVHDETYLMLWKYPDTNRARVCEIRKDGFEILGVDVIDFLRRQVALLCGLAEPEARASEEARGIGGGAVSYVLMPDRTTVPGHTTINRLGGLPIGVTSDTWPTFDGKPMYHVLTIDLNDHPCLHLPNARALALFISHPMKHEAWQPGTPHTRVLLLSDEDLENGEPNWPEGLEQDTAPSPAVFTFDDEPRTEQELFKKSFAGPSPIWLQSDDTEDCDESDDLDRRRNFVLQFGEELVRLNLGDGGVMYVFADSAWSQSY